MILLIKNLSKRFNNHVVIKDFNYEVKPNTMNALVGESGCGKTTLLNIIGLLDTPTSGDVILFDQKNVKIQSKAARLLLRNKIGYLFQNFALVENESVEYNLMMALAYVKTKNKKEIMQESLVKVGLEGFEKRKVYELSGGEQQRVAVARLLLKPCELVLADEPTGSLDEHNRDEVFGLLKQLQDQGKTIIIVTHDKKLASQCDHMIEL